jgi:glyoxylase I family protein
MTLVALLTVRRAMVDEFRRFEREAARVMARYGGAIERQVTIPDDPGGDRFREVHIVTFPDDQAWATYRSDPEMLALRPLREACVVETEILVGQEHRSRGESAAAEVLGIDHVYLSVRSLTVSEPFYDSLLVETLGFRKSRFVLGGDQHVNYFNRQFGFVIRPARDASRAHDAGLPGLHHFCFRVEGIPEVDRVAGALTALGIAASAPKLLPEYAPDYYATFIADPDGVRLEVTNFRAERKARMYLPPE